jgi:initiation factor 1A
MGKNTLGGNKQKSKKNHIIRPKSVPINEITPDNKNKFIAKVSKTLGSCRLLVTLYPTNDEYNALIPGSFKNKVWINLNDYVMVEIATELTGTNCYIIHKYESSELTELNSLGLFNPVSNDVIDDAFHFTDKELNLDSI